FSLSLEVRTAEANTGVSLPFRREEIDLVQEGTTVDGQVVAPQWSETGDALKLTLAEPGAHRLAIRFVPTIVEEGLVRRVAFEIPPVIGATLRLDYPVDAPPIDVPSSLGAVTLNAEAGQLTAQLGSS